MTYLSPERIQERTTEEPSSKGDEVNKAATPKERREYALLPDFLQHLDGIDLTAGLAYNGGEEYYLETLKLYATCADKYAGEISGFMAAGDIKNATTKIHALKSTSRIIGATELGEKAQELENAGKAGDMETLEREVPDFLKWYMQLSHSLRPLIESSPDGRDEDLPEIEKEDLEEAFDELLAYARKCDSYNIDAILKELQGFRLPKEKQEQFKALSEAASNFDFEKIKEILNKEKP